MLELYQCGVGLVVEHDLAKVETGVRFSYAAQNVSETNNFVGVSKQTALFAWRIESPEHVLLASKTARSGRRTF